MRSQQGRRATQRGDAVTADVDGEVVHARRDARIGRARRVSSAAGSSSNRSSDTQATGRSSEWAHSARRVDLPYPAGAVTPTTRRPLERAEAIREARETEPRAGGSGTDSLASSRS